MKICIPTATRAEYGLLKPLMTAVSSDPSLTLQLLVTGSHLSPSFGLTINHIISDGFSIDAKIDMLLSNDSRPAILKSMGLEMISLSETLTHLKPDLMIILGDRYEMLVMATAALICHIPVAHIHGGELTEGAIDESIRHAITKLSTIHFTSTEAYRKRVIQLGEQPDRVFNTGALGIDNFKHLSPLSRVELAQSLGITFKKYNYLVTYHPETTSDTTFSDFTQVLDALGKQEDTLYIFSKSNADEGGRLINTMIQEFVATHPRSAHLFDSLGTQRYLSLMIQSTAVIGNSSSGILEAPAARTATINIGDRQKGRIQADSIINCPPESFQIEKALKTVKSPDFRKKLVNLRNPYGDGTAAEQIIHIIKQVDLKQMIRKPFYDLGTEARPC